MSIVRGFECPVAAPRSRKHRDNQNACSVKPSFRYSPRILLDESQCLLVFRSVVDKLFPVAANQRYCRYCWDGICNCASPPNRTFGAQLAIVTLAWQSRLMPMGTPDTVRRAWTGDPIRRNANEGRAVGKRCPAGLSPDHGRLRLDSPDARRELLGAPTTVMQAHKMTISGFSIMARWPCIQAWRMIRSKCWHANHAS